MTARPWTGLYPPGVPTEVDVPNTRLDEPLATAPAAATTEELLEHCRERLARYKVPREIELRDDLPMSFVGKVLRRQLSGGHAAEG